MKRFASWLLLGALVLGNTVLLDMFYYVYNSLMYLMEDNIPFVYRAFRFIEGLLQDGGILDSTVQGVLVGLLIFLLSMFVINLSLKLAPPGFGARYLFWSTISLILCIVTLIRVIRIIIAAHLSFTEIFTVAARDPSVRIMCIHAFCYFIIGFYLMSVFEDLGCSVKLLFSNKERIILTRRPEKPEDPAFKYYAYIVPDRKILNSDKKVVFKEIEPYIKNMNSYMKSIKKQLPYANETMCVLLFGKLESPNMFRGYDCMEIVSDPKSGSVFYNQSTPLCSLLRAVMESKPLEYSDKIMRLKSSQ